MERCRSRGETVLVVDDVAEQRQIVSEMLSQRGYRVSREASGEAAVDWLRRRRADLVVPDMIMDPGMDGLETYRQMIALYPGQKTVIFSGFSETARVRAAIDLGAGPYIRKPYAWSTLGQAVRTALDGTADGDV